MVGCVIVGCGRSSSRHKGIHFYAIPKIIPNQCDNTMLLSGQRRAEWLSRINRVDLKDCDVKVHTRVCSLHFIQGKPSYLFDVSNPDWAPSLNLGQNFTKPAKLSSAERRNRRKEKLKALEAPSCDEAKTADLPQEDATPPPQSDEQSQLCGQMAEKLQSASKYRHCFVPGCTSTTISTRNKVFVSVPRDQERRIAWFKAARRETGAKLTTPMYCCEDHFDMVEDMESFVRFKMMGGFLKSKIHAVPHKFACQTTRKLSSNWETIPRASAAKRNALRLATEATGSRGSNPQGVGCDTGQELGLQDEETEEVQYPAATDTEKRLLASDLVEETNKPTTSHEAYQTRRFAYQSAEEESEDVMLERMEEVTVKLEPMEEVTVKQEYEEPAEFENDPIHEESEDEFRLQFVDIKKECVDDQSEFVEYESFSYDPLDDPLNVKQEQFGAAPDEEYPDVGRHHPLQGEYR